MAFGGIGSISGSKGSSKTSGSQKLWSDKVQKEVEDRFLNQLSTDYNFATSNDIASLMADQAGDYNIDVDAIMRNARLQAETATGQKYQSLARQAGSDANSLVAAAYAGAMADQETALAAKQAELEAQQQQGSLNALATALSGLGQNQQVQMGYTLGLGELLKGAQSSYKQSTKNKQLSWSLTGEYQGDSISPSYK